MSKKLQDLEPRLDELEQEVGRLRQRLGILPMPEEASSPTDLDSTLDCFFETVGIKGELSGLAHLRALQAEQERLWASRHQNGAENQELA
jgi:hypothetical protein